MPKHALDPLRRLCLGALPWPLFLCGEAGSGKTCAALIMLDCYGGLYSRFPEWCQRTIQAREGNLRSESGYQITLPEHWQRWERANLTVMDEIGLREQATDFQREVLLQAMDSREARPSVFISNLPLKGIHDSYDDRIASRLAGGTVILLAGDMRIQQRA